MRDPNEREKLAREQFRSLFRSFLLIAGVFMTGVVGYRLIGGEQYELLDAIYMTMITLTTVGYGEVIDLSGNPAGKVFTTGLLVVGVGSFVYFFSNFTAFVVEGSLDRLLWKRKMRNAINELDKHFIVCGAGDTGLHMLKELIETERPFVVIELDEDRGRELMTLFNTEFPMVVGDATDDDVLEQAGIRKAAGLAACIANDKDNLIITMSARLLHADMRIVSRCLDTKSRKKMLQAGADAIVSPNMIGGLRMVSELVRPAVVSFLDIMLRDRERRIRVDEFRIEADSALIGKTLDQCRAGAAELERLLVVALKRSEERWDFNPPGSAQLAAGESIVFIGEPQTRQALELASQR